MTKVKVLKIPGESVNSHHPTIGSGGVFKPPRVLADRRLSAARDDTSDLIELNVTGDEILEFEFEGGVRLWLSVEQYQQDLKDSSQQRTRSVETDSETLIIHSELPFAVPTAPTRGVLDWLIKGIRVFEANPIDKAIDSAAKAGAQVLANKIEDKLDPKPGLYRYDELETDKAITAELPDSDKPYLIFLHGTFSSVAGSFSKLWEHEEWQTLANNYPGRIYALQHRSVSESPIDNALQLLERLPANARLHLISHSRGGLIGELLCRGAVLDGKPPFSEQHIEGLFGGNNYKDERDKIERLNALLIQKKPYVERFVRVACPARGTTLASERLDRYLSVLVNVVTSIPAIDNPITGLLGDFLLAFAKQRTEPQELPGVEAMMPTSALIQLLNRPEVVTDADLSVVAGDIEGGDLWNRMKILLTDLYYWEDHDFVVNTEAMYGGTGRHKEARYFFTDGPKVNHFNYFTNPTSARRIVDGIKRVDGDLAGFKPYTRPETLVRSRSRDTKARRQARSVVFLLPGITGSHLSVKDNRIWLDPFSLGLGGLTKIEINDKNIHAEDILGLAYDDLVEFLREEHDVVTFPYDWRLSLQDEANRLANRLREQLQNTVLPIQILAHSMGGLLARVMFAQQDNADVYQQLRQRQGFRFVMLGTPNSGSHSIVRTILGREKTIKYLSLLDLKHSQEELLQIIARYPGMLELLPSADERDYFANAIWKELKNIEDEGWIEPEIEDLKIAASTWRLIRQTPLDPESTLYVAGQADFTASQLTIDNNKIKFIGTPQGDGRVPWEGGIPAGIKTYYMTGVVHGDLAKHEPAFAALQELLDTGVTNRLPTSAPATRSLEEGIILPEHDAVERFPDARDMAAAALGGSLSWHRRVREVEPPIEIEVAHGDLAYASFPVMAGHYQGDSIVSAEAALDWHLDGRLRELHRLGYYPGPVESVEVVLNPEAKNDLVKLKGAIIIGLGQIGKLSYGDLTAGVTHGAIKYAIAVVEQRQSKRRESAPLSCLLISTGAGGLSVDDALPAILRGIVRANRILNEADLGKRVRIDKVQFIELYEDRAIAAAHALQRINHDSELKNRFTVAKQLTILSGGRHRVRYEESPGWWQRLQIVGNEDGALHYSNLTTQLSRVDGRLQPTQAALLQQFVGRAVDNTRTDQATAETLFELLLPNALKNYSQTRYDLMLVVDEIAAAYPWELLQDRYDAEDEPLAVKSGLLRQLKTDTFREHPRNPVNDAVLVVGDPVTKNGKFVELPGAQQEAKQVTEQLQRAGFAVTSLIKPNAQAVIAALFTQSYRILHLAGHGVYDYIVNEEEESDKTCKKKRRQQDKGISGMVLGNDVFLTPTEVKQMREVPELVFINCCHLGRIEPDSDSNEDIARRDRHRLAANLATQLIRMGVRAVVAAGWAVDDVAAQTFAQVLYEQMLSGQTFGKAVLYARKETYLNHKSVNTWGAYQCYGDPDYRLTKRRRTDSEQTNEYFASPKEIVVVLKDIASEASGVDKKGQERLLKRVQQLKNGIYEEWKKQPQVLEAFGWAYGELNQFEQAVEHYETAIKQGDVATRTVEQHANLKTRWAIDKWRNGLTAEKAAVVDIREAVSEMERLIELTEKTPERLSLLGSAYKRLVQIQGHVGDIRDMRKYYMEAHDLAVRKTGEIDHYPLLNWLFAAKFYAMKSTAKDNAMPDNTEALLTQVEAIANSPDRSKANFWHGAIKAECALLRGLLANDIKAYQNEIVAGYQTSRKRGASAKEIRSVIEQLDFLAAMLPDDRETLNAINSTLQEA